MWNTMGMPTEHTPAAFDAFVFGELIRRAQAAQCAGLYEPAWLALEAAHVVGQGRLKPHLKTHALMLGLALRTRDWTEVAGQLFRLALVPLGHLTGRLPLGNPGRATVGAFKPLPIRPELIGLIERARAARFSPADLTG